MSVPIYRFCRFLCLVCCRLFFRLRVRGIENLPASGGFLIASNHQSYLDPILVGVSCPQNVCYMARHDLFKGAWGWLLFKVGAFPVRRNTADRSALKEALRRVRSGLPLILFPEGTRASAEDTVSRPAQAGVGFLAQKLRAQVVPVYVSGSDRAWPRHAKIFRPHQVTVFIGKPFLPDERLSYQDTAELVMETIRQLGVTSAARIQRST